MKAPWRLLEPAAIPGLIRYVVAAQAAVAVICQTAPAFRDHLELLPERILAGEFWRLVSFLAVPPRTHLLWLVLYLYFTHLLGTGLELAWGTARFNGYYWTGALLAVLAALFTPAGTAAPLFLHVSLFLAFARAFPDTRVYLLFLIPVPVRFLGYLSWLGVAAALVSGDAAGRWAILAGLANYLLFLGRGHLQDLRDGVRARSPRARAPRASAGAEGARAFLALGPVHRCAVCDRTERDGRVLSFRVCLKCGGREFCLEHLAGHACSQF